MDPHEDSGIDGGAVRKPGGMSKDEGGLAPSPGVAQAGDGRKDEDSMNDPNHLARLRELRTQLADNRPAPQGTGKVLARIDRRNGDELRVSWDSYTPPDKPGEAFPYISVRVWSNDRPTKTGVTVRLKELGDFIGAMIEASELAVEYRGTKANGNGAPAPAPRGGDDEDPTGGLF